ncbi:hypothetical protein [Roseibium sediminis]|uniref:hypothetical protein n=1 Tax=Roseibium sediminis TaxID=1775174 RepID=UPI00123C9284|nr:hypothetical protein [Roseibium sediminis]
MVRIFCLLSALVWAGFAPAANAQTVGFAEAIKILSSSCGKDIETYCKSANLGNNEIGSCLENNKSKVSDQCNVDRARVSALLEARFAAQAAVPKVCERDSRQYCKGMKPGSGHILKCLLKAEKVVGKDCNQAIDWAGYR